jgi:hypothetical protein
MIIAAIPFPSPAEQPTPVAVADFNTYVASVESRLNQRHQSPGTFVASIGQNQQRLHQGELIIERLTPPHLADLPGAMLHHWRGTAFAPGATSQDFERLMKNFNAYPQRFSPQVVTAKVLSQNGDHYQVVMRVRQKHVITVVMDTTYDITFGQLDPQHGYSISRSIRNSEIQSPGTDHERPLKPSEEHGFLWRLNTYWSYEERDGGLYMQVESVSLSRSIPRGLGWAVQPFVESVPRDSMEFTLRAACKGLQSGREKTLDVAVRGRTGR